MKVHKAVIVLALVSISMPIPSTAQRGVPKVTFYYSQIFDSSCSQATKESIPDAAVAELSGRIDHWRDVWAKNEAPLFMEVVKITKRPFLFRESRAAMILCTGITSMSIPLMLNMRPFLTVTAKGQPDSDTVFVNVLLHENLHRYTDDCLELGPGETTRLLEKYKSESPVVLNHLHLFALETLAYKALGREADLAEIVESEKRIKPGPLFSRAREIVTKETPERFVQELTQGRKGRMPDGPPGK